MADTGINWPLSWTEEFNGTLWTGGTIDDMSAVIDLDMKASIEISIDADYSDHAKATGGLFVYILRRVNEAGDYEMNPKDYPNTSAWGFEMAFAQNSTIRKTFTLHGIDISQFQIFLWWKNTTASSDVDVVTSYQKSTIPAAS